MSRPLSNFVALQGKYKFIHLLTYHLTIQGWYSGIDIGNFYQDMLDIKTRYPDSKVFLCHIFENLHWKEEKVYALECFRSILEDLKIDYYFILDGNYDQTDIVNKERILLLSWGEMITYYHLFLNDHPYNFDYKPISGKALYLMGKPQKPHRIGVLKRYYEGKKLDRLVWSFTNPDTLNKTGTNLALPKLHREFFSSYTEQEFNNFLQTCLKDLDVTDAFHTRGNFSYLGYPFDINLYNNTGFSIISETWINDNSDHLFTEKTYRTFANCHPFIMLGNTSNLIRLRSKGYRTYNEYLPVPDYCEMKNIERRIDAAYKNACFLSDAIENDITLVPKLREDARHNFRLFQHNASFNIKQFLKNAQEPEDLLLYLVEAHRQFQKWNRYTD